MTQIVGSFIPPALEFHDTPSCTWLTFDEIGEALRAKFPPNTLIPHGCRDDAEIAALCAKIPG